MNYVWDFAILGKYSHLFWLGLGWTMAYTVGTTPAPAVTARSGR